MPYLICPVCGRSLAVGPEGVLHACPDCCARLVPSERFDREPRPRVHAALEGDVNAPKAARVALEDLSQDVDPDTLGLAQLLASELVTNAVRHADRGSSDLYAWLDRERLRIEVRDQGPGFEAEDRLGGWGLHIVDELSDDWGVSDGAGTRVWCDVLLNGAA